MVLAIVHTVTAGQRLLDVVRLVESDLRIQVVFTMAPDVFSNGVEEFLRGIGGVTVPWQQATQLRFALALAAGSEAIHEIHAPLIVMPHGASYNKLAVRRSGGGVIATRGTHGLDRETLVHGGAVVPAAVALPHQEELARLAHACPEALPTAVVVGDPCYDRLAVSLPMREFYRRALGVGPGQKLVVVSSTWGPRSLFGRRDDVLPRLLAELPSSEYRVMALMHPNVWFGHGSWQLRTWLADCLRRGLSLLPPEADWRSPLVAADWVVGDHGSATLYSAVAGVPVLLASFADEDVDPSSAMAELAAVAARLSSKRPLLPQLQNATVDYRPDLYQPVISRISSEPGAFNRNMRRLMYQVLGLRQPATIPTTDPVSPPVRLD
jgi:hypothetical protein